MSTQCYDYQEEKNMIVLNVTYTCKPGKRRAFYEELIPKAEYFRKEKGCVQYAYFEALEDENRLLLVEKWEDETALGAHASTEIFKSLGAVKEGFVEDTKLEKFVV